MKILKMNETILIVVSMCVSFVACSGNSNTSKQNEKRTEIYIVNHADDVGKHGEGTYINMDTEYKDRDGIRWSKDNIFAPGPGESLSDEKFQRSTSGNQYGKGYEQGQEDAQRGLEADPEGYGGNGQFEKGYEDGYEDW